MQAGDNVGEELHNLSHKVADVGTVRRGLGRGKCLLNQTPGREAIITGVTNSEPEMWALNPIKKVQVHNTCSKGRVGL